MTNENARLPREVELAANIVAGYVRRTETRPEEFGSLLNAAYDGIIALTARVSGGDVAQQSPSAPRRAADAPSDPSADREAGFVREGVRTVTSERLVCLDDGKEVTFLGRHLRAKGIDARDYLSRWKLPSDYPMTAPAFVERRRADARKSGFGTSMRPNRERVAEGPEGGGEEAAPTRRRRADSGERQEGTLSPAYH
jgi:predicted transcriptional regulator